MVEELRLFESMLPLLSFKLKQNVKLSGSLFPRQCFPESVNVCHDAGSEFSIIPVSSEMLSFLLNFFLKYPSSLRFYFSALFLLLLKSSDRFLIQNTLSQM